MGARTSIDVERSVTMLQTACNKSTVLVVAVSQCLQDGDRTAVCECPGALTDFRYRNDIPHMNINGGMFLDDHMAHVLGISAAPQRPDITLICSFAGYKPTEHLWDILDQRVHQLIQPH